MTMPILRVGLIVGSLGCLYVTWASTGAGFPIEVAVVRGMLAFMALSFMAYVGELVVKTAPPVAAVDAVAEPDAAAEPGEHEPEDHSEQSERRDADSPRPAALAPIPRPTDNDELQAA